MACRTSPHMPYMWDPRNKLLTLFRPALPRRCLRLGSLCSWTKWLESKASPCEPTG